MERGGEFPHLELTVGSGLCVSIQTSGSPTPTCIIESLRSQSTKQLLDYRERYGRSRTAKSASHLAQDSHIVQVGEGPRYVHSPASFLGAYRHKKGLQLSGLSWSPLASVSEIRGHVSKSMAKSQEGDVLHAESVNRVSMHNQPPSKLQSHQRSHSFNCGRGESTSLLSREQAPPTYRRRILTDYEKNLTFKPKLNDYSLKIASRNARLSLPLVHRLSEVRRNESLPHYDKEHLTFAPKLNPLSLKLAHERAARMPEVCEYPLFVLCHDNGYKRYRHSILLCGKSRNCINCRAILFVDELACLSVKHVYCRFP